MNKYLVSEGMKHQLITNSVGTFDLEELELMKIRDKDLYYETAIHCLLVSFNGLVEQLKSLEQRKAYELEKQSKEFQAELEKLK